MAPRGQFQRLGIGRDRAVQQISLRIEPAQSHISIGHIGLQAQPRRGQIARTSRRLGTGRSNARAYPAPQIHLIGQLSADAKIIIHSGRTWAQRAILRQARPRRRPARINLGQQRRRADGLARAGLIIAGQCHRQRRAGLLRTRFQIIEYRVMKRMPPRPARRAIQRRCIRPAGRFRKTLGHSHRRRAIGRCHRATRQPRASDQPSPALIGHALPPHPSWPHPPWPHPPWLASPWPHGPDRWRPADAPSRGPCRR